MEKTSGQKDRASRKRTTAGPDSRCLAEADVGFVHYNCRFPFPSKSIIQTVFDSCARRLYHGLFSVLFVCLSYFLSSFVYCSLPVFLSVCLLGSGSEGDKIL